MRRQTTLGIIDNPVEEVSLLKVVRPPGLHGSEAEDLLCGGCGVVLVEGMSARSAKTRYMAPAQIVIECPCGTYNVLPSTAASEISASH